MTFVHLVIFIQILELQTEGKTETNPGHTSILTGTWQQIANDGSERPTKPTVFEYIQKGRWKSSVILITTVTGGKDKLGYTYLLSIFRLWLCLWRNLDWRR